MISWMRGTSWMVALRIIFPVRLTSSVKVAVASIISNTRNAPASSPYAGRTEVGTDRSPQLEDELDFHGRVQRERVHAYRGPGVFPGLAEELQQELAGAVGDLRLLGEVGVGADERPDPHHARQPAQVGLDRPDRRQRVDHALPGRGFRLLDRTPRRHLPDGEQLPVLHRQLPGDENEVPRPLGGDVRAEGAGD